MARCKECFFCKDREENGEKVMRCSVSGRKLTDESESCGNLMRK